MTSYVSCDELRGRMEAGVELLLLDCRHNDSYRRGHVTGSHSIVLPQLMMRRLKANKLSLRSLAQHDKDEFLRKCMRCPVVIYDSSDDDDECAAAENTSNNICGDDDSLKRLLHRRMAHEGCQVEILKGGFTAFAERHPDACMLRTSAASSDVDDDYETSSSSSPLSLPIALGRCSPASPLRIGGTDLHHITSGAPPPVLGLGTLRIGGTGGNASEPEEHDGCRRHRRGGSNDGCDSAGEEEESYGAKCTCLDGTGTDMGGRPSRQITAPAEILPGLFLGCAKDAADRDCLASNDITHILNVTPNLPNVFEAEARYKYKQIPIVDHWNQNLSQFFPEAIQFIDEARNSGHGVLVHCLAGISRSVTLTVAYLMQTRRWSLNQAYDFVKLRKSNVSPNFNFMGQLLDFEKQLNIPNSTSSSSSSSAASNSTSSSGGSGSASSPTLFFTTPATPKSAAPNGGSFIIPAPLA